MSMTELDVPGLPTVAAVLAELREADALGEFIVCEPCAMARNIIEGHLRGFAELGSAADLARLAGEHDTTVTF